MKAIDKTLSQGRTLMKENKSRNTVPTVNRDIHQSAILRADEYQRMENKNRIASIVKNYDPDAFGSITVGEREDGTFWVVDGFQRLSAARRLGIQVLSCDVFKSSGPAHEAKVFRIKNNDRTSVSARQIFQARLIAGEEQAKEIDAAVKKAGLKLHLKDSGGTASNGYPYIRAVRSLDSAYQKIGKAGIVYALGLLTSAWPGDPDSLQGDLIDGMSWFIKKFPSFDEERLIKKLRMINPSGVIRAADARFELLRQGRSIGGGGRPLVTCEAIVAIYNERLRIGRLEWK